MSINKVVETLKKSELFSDLSQDELLSIAEFGNIETFNTGETIYSQGSIGKKIYILSEGQVSLEREVTLGGGQRKANITAFIQRETPSRRLMGCWGALVGEEHIQMCTARCDKPTVVVSIIGEKFKEVLSKNLDIKVKILGKLILLLKNRIVSSYEAIETL